MNVISISKKTTTFLFFLLMLVSITSQAQSFLSAKVVDNEQTPLSGATVQVLQQNKAAVTDNQGAFSIKLPKGSYTLKIAYLGFQSVTKEISTEVNDLVIVLTPEENVLDEVLVSSIRATENTPVTFSNLSKEEIAKRNLGQDIPTLINYLPSVITSSDAGAGIGYTYMRVRGSDETRINVTINGIPYNDAESQGTFWVNIGDFASSTENLQLQRGVGTSTNGAGAFGGSLNILTDAISEKANGEISNSFGSFNSRKHTVKFSTGKLNNHFELAGRVSNISSDGYVDRASTDLKSYFLQGSYIDDNTLIKAVVFGGKEKTYQAWFGLTADELEEDRRQNPYTYDNETDNYQQDHYQLHWNEKINKNWSTNLGLNYTKGQGYFEQFKDDTDKIDLYNGIVVATDSYVDDWGEIIPITDVIVRRWLDNDFYVANASANYSSNLLDVITGISYSHYTNDHFGEVIWAKELSSSANIRDRYYFSDSQKEDYSSFIKANFKLNKKLTGYVDLQGRIVTYKTKGLTSDRDPIDVDKTFKFFNPKAGLTFNLNDANNFYASYARANREPNRNDFEGGNSQHESLDDYELGWRFKTDKVKLNTNVYFMNYKNQLVLSGAIDDVGEPIRITSGESYRLGLEIDADIKLIDQISLRPNIAISRNRNIDFNAPIDGEIKNLGDTQISNSPDLIIGNVLSIKPTANLEVNFLSKYVGEQYMGNLGGEVSSTEKLDRYFTSDLNVVYEIKTKSVFKSIVLSGVINNLFDYEYVNRGYYFYYDDTWTDETVTTTVDGAGYYPQATINFLLGATLKF